MLSLIHCATTSHALGHSYLVSLLVMASLYPHFLICRIFYWIRFLFTCNYNNMRFVSDQCTKIMLSTMQLMCVCVWGGGGGGGGRSDWTLRDFTLFDAAA